MNQAASHRQGCGKGRALAARPRETAGFASPRPRSGPFWLSQSCWAAGASCFWPGGPAELRLRLAEPDVTPQEIEAAAEHGRAAVYELLKIFSSTAKEPERRAAGIALARLWLLDHLVAEEEQAVVRRGYTVTWSARRRYPRALRAVIPIVVSYEVPFLEDGGRLIGPANLEWSHRLLGARRAALETVFPLDRRAADGWPSALFPATSRPMARTGSCSQARVRTAASLTDSWEIALPHIPFQFEFDPLLQLDAILTLPDSVRDEEIARAIRLEPGEAAPGEPATFLSVGEDWTLRNPPGLAVTTPLACDLAHSISVEFEGMAATVPAGQLILSGQGTAPRDPGSGTTIVRRFALDPIAPAPEGLFERPGVRRMRASLSVAPESGWADPLVRSIWPGQVRTNWVDVEILRR